MAYRNGRLPASTLGPIPGPNAGLRADAARAYRAMAIRCRAIGVNMALNDGVVGRTYRSYARQVLAKSIYGANAATPGTSNHGWGLAVDLQSWAQRRAVDRVGRSFGWAKAWSDASWEWWHLRWRPGAYAAVKAGARTPTLRQGHAGPSVKRLQRLLRALNVKGAPRPSGYFNRATRKAVWRFQRKHGLPADGVVGPATWRALKRRVR